MCRTSYTVRKAAFSEAEQVVLLIRRRIAWMDANGIEQWNRTAYLDAYSRSYFERMAAGGALYAVEAEGRLVGAFVLLGSDRRWSDDGRKALYIHNLVSDPRYRGVGDAVFGCCEELARKTGAVRLRLDCQAANTRLNAYYAHRGFGYVGTFTEGAYTGNKREKTILCGDNLCPQT